MGNVFQFSSSASLEKLTGQRAYDLETLLDLIKNCSESSIFYHTFSAFLKMKAVGAPYSNDFALWVSRILNEKALAERLMAIDFSEYSTLQSLRLRLIELIETYRDQRPAAFKKTADDPFFLYDLVRVVYLTDKFAYNLESFRQILTTISIDSIYFHFIESRIESQHHTDDFSHWIGESLEIPELARKVREIDISVYTLEGLRSKILQLIDAYMKGNI
jgi:hypothetical protein